MAATTGENEEEKFLVASCLVADAVAGSNGHYRFTAEAVNSYKSYNSVRWKSLFFGMLVLDLCLVFMEKPSVFPAFNQNKFLSVWLPFALETICLVAFICRVYHRISFHTPYGFWTDKKNVTILAIIALTVVDMLVFLIFQIAMQQSFLRVTRCLRPFLVVNYPEGRHLRRTFRTIRQTVYSASYVILVLFFHWFLFSLIAYKMLEPRGLFYPDGRPYFQSLIESLWEMYVLITTANNPDVMMPAFNVSGFYVLFFVLYLVICLYMLMSILLAAVFYNYKEHLKNEVKRSVLSKFLKMVRAFYLLVADDVWKATKRNTSEAGSPRVISVDATADQFRLSYERWSHLVKLVDPKKTDAQIELLFAVIDSDRDGFITRQEFVRTADIINIKLTERQDRLNVFERFIPAIYNSGPSSAVRHAVKSRYFRWFFSLLIIVNAIFMIIDGLDFMEWIFLGLFTVEILLKLYTISFLRFFTKFWNIFDAVVIGGAIVIAAVGALFQPGTDVVNSLEFFILLRVLRLLKLIKNLKSFRVIVDTLINVIQSIFYYVLVLLICYYFFAVIGMELYAEKIQFFGENTYNSSHWAAVNLSYQYCGNSLLKESSFYDAQYCQNNFNNVALAFSTLFVVMVVNQWHVITQGFEIVTSPWTRLYFWSFHFVCVVLLLNIVIAFILEAFILEFHVKEATFETAVERTIKAFGLDPDSDKKDKPSNNTKENRQANRTHAYVNRTASSEPTNDAENSAGSDIPAGFGDEDDGEDVLGDGLQRQPSVALRRLRNHQRAGVRIHLKKQKQKSAEMLLEQMFANELPSDDEIMRSALETLRLTPLTHTNDVEGDNYDEVAKFGGNRLQLLARYMSKRIGGSRKQRFFPQTSTIEESPEGVEEGSVRQTSAASQETLDSQPSGSVGSTGPSTDSPTVPSAAAVSARNRDGVYIVSLSSLINNDPDDALNNPALLSRLRSKTLNEFI